VTKTRLRCTESQRKWVVVTRDFMVAALWFILCLWNWSWLGPAWVAAMRPEPDHVVDFYQEWGSTQNYWTGLPIYTSHSVSIPRYLGLPSNPAPGIEYNIHPPTSVLLMLPLGRLDYPDAVFIWNAISLVALLASVAIVAKVFSAPKSLILPALALLPLCHPVYGNFHQGQINLILVLLVTGMWALERSGRSNTAALLLGAAAAIKLFPAYLVIYYAAQGRGRPLLAALVSFLTLTMITALVLGLDSYHDYVGIVLPWNSEFRILGYNISIAGLWHKLFHPVPGENIIPLWSSLALARCGTLLSSLTITAVVATFAYHAQTAAQRELAFATTVTAMLLVSPVTWDTSLPILLAPFAFIARDLITARSHWLTATLVLILATNWAPQQILTGLALPGHSMTDYSWTFMLGAPSLKFYALLGTFMLGLIAFQFEAANPHLKPAGSDLAT
jgi:hypothetical protein